MDSLISLKNLLEQRLSAVSHTRQQSRERLREAMVETERKSETFRQVAEKLFNETIVPRLTLISEMFPSARLDLAAERLEGICRFCHAADFPATAVVQFNLLHDRDFESVLIKYALEILPIYISFPKADEISVPLDAVDEPGLGRWMDAKLLDFADAYQQIQSSEQYQRENMVVDPVCGMRFNRVNTAASVEENGKVYYFCVDDCRRNFLERRKHSPT